MCPHRDWCKISLSLVCVFLVGRLPLAAAGDYLLLDYITNEAERWQDRFSKLFVHNKEVHF